MKTLLLVGESFLFILIIDVMKPILRNYQSEEDYWCIREFLREVSMLNNCHDFAWSLLRWDYWRWHVNENIFHFDLREVVTLWELNGQIVAMVNPDGDGEAFFQIYPAFRDDVAMSEMLDVAEEKLPKIKNNDKKELIVWVNAADDLTKNLFTERGYSRSKFLAEYMRRRLFSKPIPDSTTPRDTTFAPWVTRANCPRAVGYRGRRFIPKNPMKNIRAGNGTRIFNVCRSIAAIWISSSLQKMANSLHSARSGMTM